MTLLIKNVKILGGAGKYTEPADVFVSGDKISAIGNFSNKNADEVIEGNGAYLAPGFIDVNTDSDHYLSLFDYPQQDDFIKQGVTTIIGGMCGSSLAPLLYGSLESIRKWGDINKVNVNWHTMAEFLALLDKKPLAVNFATLVGHSTIRRAIVGEHLRDLVKSELEVFGATLRRALEEGSFGLSTGLSYVHEFRTSYPEIKFLAKIVKSYNGVYATHLRRGGDGLLSSVEETIKVAKDSGAKTTISHFMPLVGAEKQYEEALAKIESLPGTQDFNFDVYPYDTSLLALYTFLPLWVQSGNREAMLANIKDEWLRPKIEKDMAKINPENFVVANTPHHDFLVGRSLKDLSKIYNIPDYRSTLLKLMEVTELKATVFYKNINKNSINLAIKSPRSLIATNAASFVESGRALKPERAISTFTKFLSMTVPEKIMPLEEAIKKITLEPARKFDLIGRGVIKEGNFADLTLFSLGEQAENVAGRKNAEIKAVVVNGGVVLKDGGTTGRLSGRALRHNAKSTF